MKITLDATKTAEQNAADYYSKASKLKAKAEAAQKALQGTLRQVEREERKAKYAVENPAPVEEARPKVRKKRNLEWYEHYRWFFTSNGLLVIGGRDATQNEQVFGRHAQEGDLFFHADVHGAPATLIKEGEAKATEQDKAEAAQFAASYSSSWKNGFGSADVYCVPTASVSKSAKSGEYVGKGGFIISGKREWFRNCELKLFIGVDSKDRIACQPALCKTPLARASAIMPGGKEKGAVAKELSKTLGAGHYLDEILLVLPTGNSDILPGKKDAKPQK